MKYTKYTFNQLFGLSIILTTVLRAAIGPLLALTGISLGSFSLFEFYFINILVSEHPGIQYNTTDHWNFFKDDIRKSFLLTTAIISAAWSVAPAAAIFGFTMFPSLTMSMIALPISIKLAASTYLGLHILASLASSYMSSPFYKLLQLQPIILSVAFASLTNIAFSWVNTYMWLSCVFYGLSLAPLTFFAYNAWMGSSSRLFQDKKSGHHFPYAVGVTSLIIHIAEASSRLIALNPRSTTIATKIAAKIASPTVQVPLLVLTTACSICTVMKDYCGMGNQTEVSA